MTINSVHPAPAPAALLASVLSGQDAAADWQEALYRDLHEHPELSGEETQTALRIAAELRHLGFTVTENIGGHGVVGVLENGPGERVLMRADIDALPVREATGLGYASTVMVTAAGAHTPVMHACGHDTHISALLGAARLLAEHREAWTGTYIALFQPAEETAGGAQAMVDDHLATRIPTPTVALAQHVMPFPAGTVATRPGPLMAVADSIRITVHGRGGHGSMPFLTVDPAPLIAAIVLRLNLIISREINANDMAVLTIGRIAVGTKSNVIADHGVLELNLRTYSDVVRAQILAAIRRIVNAECAASGSPAPAEFEYYDHFPLTANDAPTTAIVQSAFTEHFGSAASECAPMAGSEDFSTIPDVLGVPYCYWLFGGTDPQLWESARSAGTLGSAIPSNHSAGFAPIIEPTLRTGTAAAVVAALAWLAVR